MKTNKKIIISAILVIIWMIVIFAFSVMPSNESNEKSKGVISKVVEIKPEEDWVVLCLC